MNPNDESLKCCNYSLLAYLNPKENNDKCQELNIKEPFFFDSSETGFVDAQVYIFEKDEKLIISCRGTESKLDIWADLKIWKDGLTDIYYHNNFKKFVDTYNLPYVHSGFYQQYNSIKFIIYSKILNYLEKNYENPDIMFCGHSLGGALATLGAICMKIQFLNRKNLRISCETFGSPRVGNQDFVKIFNKFIDYSVRIVNYLDPIPMVPRINGYQHVKGLQHINSEESKSYDFNQPYEQFNQYFFFITNLFICQPDDHKLNNYFENLKKLIN